MALDEVLIIRAASELVEVDGGFELCEETLRVVHLLLTRSKSSGTCLLCLVVIIIQSVRISGGPFPRLLGAHQEFRAVSSQIWVGAVGIDFGGVGECRRAH